jgi:filamentous hemagglutinin family protein
MRTPFCILLLLLISVSAHAEAIFDGTMNPETKGQTLSGNIVVREADGRLVGDNLFHSFSHFSVNKGEKATFYSSDNINNIISRVTGNDISLIDGPLRSFINGSSKTSPANFYLINPNGIMFGSNARLDIGGSFYVLTCDYLKMDDGQTYDIHSDNPVLSMDSPYAFGFLEKSSGKIEIDGGDTNFELNVDFKQQITLIGKGIDIKNSFVSAPEGQIFIASISGACEIIPTSNGYENMDTIDRNPISIVKNSELNVSGNGSGDIFVMGAHVLFSESYIEARTEGKQNGGLTLIDASSVRFENKAQIYSDNISYPDITSLNDYYGGNVRIQSSGDVVFTNKSKIEIGAVSTHNRDLFCHAGSVEIEASSVSLFDSSISSHSLNAGKTGNIDIIAKKNMLFSHSYLYAETWADTHDASDNRSKTKINIDADSIAFVNNGGIASQTYNYGYGGDIFIHAKNDIHMDTGSITSYCHTSIDKPDTIIQGKSGDINIETGSFLMTNQSEMVASTSDQRPGGHIEINVSDRMYLDQSRISSESTALDGGAAGKININAGDSIHLWHNSALTTEAINAEDNESVGKGEIVTTAKNTIFLMDSKITSSVLGGKENAGNIDTFADTIVMNRSNIIAKADQGRGGNIHIVAEQFIQSADSVVDASSNKGIDGEVTIDSPEINAESGLIFLSSDFLDASQWMKNSCGHRFTENTSRLIVRGKDATPTKPDDLHSSPAIVLKDLHLKQPDIKREITEAEICYQKGDFASAAKIWLDAEKRLNKDTKNYLITVTYLIQALQSIGFHQKALIIGKKALSIAEKSKPSQERILFYNSYGDLLLTLNELPDAVTYLKIALKDAKKSKNKAIMASVMNHIANAVIVDGDIKTGIQIYDNALIFLSRSDKTALKSKIYLNLAYVISMIGTYEETITAFNDALSIVQLLPDNHEKAFDYISLSKTGLLIDNFFPDKKTQSSISYGLLTSAQKIGETINDLKLISMASGNAAKILEKSGQYEKALEKTRYALFTSEQKNMKDIAYKWHWQAGRLFKKMEKETQAIDSYKNAISMLSSIREELFSGVRLKMDIFDVDIKPVYLGLAEIYLDQADRESHPQKIEQKILLARDVMESQKNAELSDYFEDECVANKRKMQPNALTRTPEGVALLYPIALPDRLTILITLPDEIKHYNVDMGYNELNKLVRSYRKYIQVRSSNQFLGVSQKLYQLLIRPVEKDLLAANINTLLVAPDGVLRLVPFCSLHNNKSFLIEKYAIVTIPAVNLTDTNPSTYRNKKMKTLVVGLSDAVQGFSALPSINEELRDIKKIMNGKKIYKNAEYTISNVQKEFKTNDYSIVHFATHGVFGGSGKNSFLLTYESHLDMNKLEDLMSLGKYRNHQVDMLTLSACQTALGNERAALGLAGVAVKAGVRSAVATLWYVDDQATSLAIRELYRQLKKDNMTKAKALQNAQKKLLSMHRYWHPIYWAPFLLIGSWI